MTLNQRLTPTSERWCTPPEIWSPLHQEFRFTLDAAADPETTRLPRYLTDALSAEPWGSPGERVWLNPPYGRKLEPFVRRAALEAKSRIVVALIPFRCRGAWWHEAVLGKAKEVRCVRKRIKFMRPDGTQPKFGLSCDSCVVVWDGEGTGTSQLRGWSW